MKILKLLLKWGLIIFLIVSCVIAARRCYQTSYVPPQDVNFNQLQPLVNGQIQLVLFHNQKRCHQCLQMEQLSKDVVDQFYVDNVKSTSLDFKTLSIDDPENRGMVNQFGIFAATLVLMEFNDDELVYARILTEGPELYKQEAEFKKYLTKELSEILSTAHE